jgi:hypothetical protein
MHIGWPSEQEHFTVGGPNPFEPVQVLVLPLASKQVSNGTLAQRGWPASPQFVAAQAYGTPALFKQVVASGGSTASPGKEMDSVLDGVSI